MNVINYYYFLFSLELYRFDILMRTSFIKDCLLSIINGFTLLKVITLNGRYFRKWSVVQYLSEIVWDYLLVSE